MLILESVINRYLALDPEVLAKLGGLSGKVIKLDMTGTNKQLYLFPADNGIQVTEEYDGDADTTLRGSPIALFKMGVVTNTASLLLKGEVEIIGDTRLGHQFKTIFSQMDIDWSEPLADILGDELAYQLQISGNSVIKWGRESIKSFSMNVSEYLQEESRDVLTDTELEIFNTNVDQLREDVDRLQARLNSLLK